MLARPLEVTAPVMANDVLAPGFMRVAQQRGIRIPQQVSIVGFDNIPEGTLVWPGLTRVAQPMNEMRRSACRRLFEAMDKPGNTEIVEYPRGSAVRKGTGLAAQRL